MNKSKKALTSFHALPSALKIRAKFVMREDIIISQDQIISISSDKKKVENRIPSVIKSLLV